MNNVFVLKCTPPPKKKSHFLIINKLQKRKSLPRPSNDGIVVIESFQVLPELSRAPEVRGSAGG